MKKIVFAVQVLGLIALLPILVILEMNHVAHNAPAYNDPSRVIRNTAETSFRLREKVTDRMVNEVFPVTSGTLFLIKAF